ncbi:MAG TPA: LeuA family protein [Gemmatimonadales bacterium]|nr:LeuA family protein [Gemmatimonadales bacterium]
MADRPDSSPRPGDSGKLPAHRLIHDWNARGRSFDFAAARIELFDQTLRDGLQAPSVQDPSPEQKRELLHLMVALGIDALDIGLPAAGARMRQQTRALAAEIADRHLPIAASCAARARVEDIEPILQIGQSTGCPVEVAVFLGASELRHFVEGWNLTGLVVDVERAVRFAAREGHPVMFVAEDATRAHPETLHLLLAAAVEAGATRICLADTAGHALPSGVRALIEFVRHELIHAGARSVGIDWHGHRDRGLGLANCLSAIEAGANRIHATALGIGERAGNAEMDLLLLNLHLLGAERPGLARLAEYCAMVSRATGVPLPDNYPIVGSDVFRTGSGTHAAAILKAREKGRPELADLVYSSVPAALFGREQQIAISAHSGSSNVRAWLLENGYDPEDEQAVSAILSVAKESARRLTDLECHRLAVSAGTRIAAGAADVSH